MSVTLLTLTPQVSLTMGGTSASLRRPVTVAAALAEATLVTALRAEGEPFRLAYESRQSISGLCPSSAVCCGSGASRVAVSLAHNSTWMQRFRVTLADASVRVSVNVSTPDQVLAAVNLSVPDSASRVIGSIRVDVANWPLRLAFPLLGTDFVQRLAGRASTPSAFDPMLELQYFGSGTNQLGMSADSFFRSFECSMRRGELTVLDPDWPDSASDQLAPFRDSSYATLLGLYGQQSFSEVVSAGSEPGLFLLRTTYRLPEEDGSMPDGFPSASITITAPTSAWDIEITNAVSEIRIQHAGLLQPSALLPNTVSIFVDAVSSAPAVSATIQLNCTCLRAMPDGSSPQSEALWFPPQTKTLRLNVASRWTLPLTLRREREEVTCNCTAGLATNSSLFRFSVNTTKVLQAPPQPAAPGGAPQQQPVVLCEPPREFQRVGNLTFCSLPCTSDEEWNVALRSCVSICAKKTPGIWLYNSTTRLCYQASCSSAPFPGTALEPCRTTVRNITQLSINCSNGDLQSDNRSCVCWPGWRTARNTSLLNLTWCTERDLGITDGSVSRVSVTGVLAIALLVATSCVCCACAWRVGKCCWRCCCRSKRKSASEGSDESEDDERERRSARSRRREREQRRRPAEAVVAPADRAPPPPAVAQVDDDDPWPEEREPRQPA